MPCLRFRNELENPTELGPDCVGDKEYWHSFQVGYYAPPPHQLILYRNKRSITVLVVANYKHPIKNITR